MKRIIGLGCAIVLLSLSIETPATESMTANTLRLSPGEKPPPAAIDDMAWLAGRWSGEGLGGLNEETWSPPAGGAMLGMYRLIKDAAPVFCELLALTRSEGSLLLSLRHFHPDLRGWEDGAAPVRMPLVAKQGRRLYFEGITFERSSDDEITIYLAIESRQDASIKEEVFKYTRSWPSNRTGG